MNSYKKPPYCRHVGTIDLLVDKCNEIHKIFYMSNEKTYFRTILSKFVAYTKPINASCSHFNMEAFKCYFMTFISGQRFAEFLFSTFIWYKSKLFNYNCIRMEIIVLYCKLFGRKSWFNCRKYLFTWFRYASPGKLNLRQ